MKKEIQKKRVDFYNVTLFNLFKKELVKLISENEDNVSSIDDTYAKGISSEELTALFSNIVKELKKYRQVNLNYKSTVLYSVRINNNMIIGVVLFPSGNKTIIINQKNIKKSWVKKPVDLLDLYQSPTLYSVENTLEILTAASKAINKYLELNPNKTFIVNYELAKFE